MYTCSRLIGIDAGHRIPTHGSKCKHLHGHRYTIEATCEAKALVEEGVQSGMVLDFGFLKEEMLRMIHDPCDHTMMLWVEDTFVQDVLTWPRDQISLRQEVETSGGCIRIPQDEIGSVCLMAQIPTAENLARLWFHKLAPEVINRSEGKAELISLKVWETPNCAATYRPSKS